MDRERHQISFWTESQLEPKFSLPCPHGRTGHGLPKGKRLLSISKRTDIPAFYLPWLLERIEIGWVDVPNPMLTRALLKIVADHVPDAYPARLGRIAGRRKLDWAFQTAPWPEEKDAEVARLTTHVSLRSQDILGVVWWSKNYAVYLRCVDRIDRYWKDIPQYFHFTINPRRDDLQWLEPDVPPLDEAIRQLQELARLARDRGRQSDGGDGLPITWRYDPLVFWYEGEEPKSSWDSEFFELMCSVCREVGIVTCVTSIVDHYKKFLRRMRAHQPGRVLREPGRQEIQQIARTMVRIARRYGITVQTCAESAEKGFVELGITAASCIDRCTLVGPSQVSAASDRRFATRTACGCHQHTDIGDYEWQECGYACIYCYANPNHRYYALKH